MNHTVKEIYLVLLRYECRGTKDLVVSPNGTLFYKRDKPFPGYIDLQEYLLR